MAFGGEADGRPIKLCRALEASAIESHSIELVASELFATNKPRLEPGIPASLNSHQYTALDCLPSFHHHSATFITQRNRTTPASETWSKSSTTVHPTLDERPHFSPATLRVSHFLWSIEAAENALGDSGLCARPGEISQVSKRPSLGSLRRESHLVRPLHSPPFLREIDSTSRANTEGETVYSNADRSEAPSPVLSQPPTFFSKSLLSRDGTTLTLLSKMSRAQAAASQARNLGSWSLGIS